MYPERLFKGPCTVMVDGGKVRFDDECVAVRYAVRCKDDGQIVGIWPCGSDRPALRVRAGETAGHLLYRLTTSFQ